MQLLTVSSLNPSVSFSENPEQFILEHCGNLAKVGTSPKDSKIDSYSIEERILEFVRKLLKNKIYVPPLDLDKFPKELHTVRIKKMCSHLSQVAA